MFRQFLRAQAGALRRDPPNPTLTGPCPLARTDRRRVDQPPWRRRQGRRHCPFSRSRRSAPPIADPVCLGGRKRAIVAHGRVSEGSGVRRASHPETHGGGGNGAVEDNDSRVQHRSGGEWMRDGARQKYRVREGRRIGQTLHGMSPLQYSSSQPSLINTYLQLKK